MTRPPEIRAAGSDRALDRASPIDEITETALARNGNSYPDRVTWTPPRRALPVARWTALGVVLVLVGAASAFVGALLWPPTYAARAAVLYEISQEKPTGFLREDRSLTTQLVLLRSRRVLGPVAAASGVPPEDLEKDVTISLLDSSEVIQVEARAATRQEAVRRTSAIVGQYMGLAGIDRTAAVETHLRDQLAATQADLSAARSESERQRAIQSAGMSGYSSEVSSSEARVQSIEGREQQLLSQIDEATTVRMTASKPEVIAPAYAVRDQVSPKPLFATTAGALTGLVVAAAVVGLLAYRRNRVA